MPDIRSAYLAAPLFVAPMLVNTGLQNKLLEAMALGRVCITTPRALSAMGKDPGATVISAGEPEDFAREIARWLDDEEGQIRMGRRPDNGSPRRSIGRQPRQPCCLADESCPKGRFSLIRPRIFEHRRPFPFDASRSFTDPRRTGCALPKT